MRSKVKVTNLPQIPKIMIFQVLFNVENCYLVFSEAHDFNMQSYLQLMIWKTFLECYSCWDFHIYNMISLPYKKRFVWGQLVIKHFKDFQGFYCSILPPMVIHEWVKGQGHNITPKTEYHEFFKKYSMYRSVVWY